jgi:hypothetical protein
LVGTTSANKGTSASISHGLSTANIIGVQVFVQDDAGNWLPPEIPFYQEFDLLTINQILRLWFKTMLDRVGKF